MVILKSMVPSIQLCLCAFKILPTPNLPFLLEWSCDFFFFFFRLGGVVVLGSDWFCSVLCLCSWVGCLFAVFSIGFVLVKPWI